MFCYERLVQTSIRGPNLKPRNMPRPQKQTLEQKKQKKQQKKQQDDAQKRLRKGAGADVSDLLVKARGDDAGTLQYQRLSSGIEVVESTLRGTFSALQKALVEDVTDDDHINVLKAAAQSMIRNKSCREDANANYVLKSMVKYCTDALVAFKGGEPVGFALLDKESKKDDGETDVLMLCASEEKGKGAGKALMNLVIKAARAQRRLLTLTALPNVLGYYYKLGFRFGRNCTDHVVLDNERLVLNRLELGENGKDDLRPIAALIVELQLKGLQHDEKAACTKQGLTCDELVAAGCHEDGYYMHFCPPPAHAPAPAARPPSPDAQALSPAAQAPALASRARSRPKSKRARAGQKAPRQKQVSKKRLLETREEDSQGLYYRRRTKDKETGHVTTEDFSWAQLQNEDETRRRRVEAAKGRRRPLTHAEKTARKDDREKAAGKCHSKSEVYRLGKNDTSYRVCTGNPKLGNYKRLTYQELEEGLDTWGECKSRSFLDQNPEDETARLCTGNPDYGNYQRLTKEQVDRLENEYGYCAKKSDVRKSKPDSNMRYCFRDKDTHKQVRLNSEQLAAYEASANDRPREHRERANGAVRRAARRQ